MKRKIFFYGGVIEGEHKDFLCGVFPELEPYFERRKNYYEFYYKGYEIEVELTLDKIDKLSSYMRMTIDSGSINFFL